jgi:hypothetical protein
MEATKPAVGDLSSAEKGSGARFNAGKDRLDLIPVAIQAAVYRRPKVLYDPSFCPKNRAKVAMLALGDFMRSGDSQWLYEAIVAIDPRLDGAAMVFEYGAKKYAAWNWIKGMQWSVPVGCISRHVRAIMVDGEIDDPESKLPHVGHISCNLIMLAQYDLTYLEGNDLVPKEYLRRFRMATKQTVWAGDTLTKHAVGDQCT